MQKNALEALHVNLCGAEPVARWSKVEIAAAIISHVVEKP